MLRMLGKLLLFARTIWYLRPIQVKFYIIRRFMPHGKVYHCGNAIAPSELSLTPPRQVSGIYQGENNRFRFINRVIDLGERPLSWRPEFAQRLWCYNLHYFDFLREIKRPPANKLWLINDWIENNPLGSKPAWEAFPTSLRIVNWIFHLTENPGHATPTVLKSLYLQALWLEKNDERHILANHFFENLKALLFAGAFFRGRDAERWLRKGNKTLLQELGEQFFRDGGHYERSPQYHGLMLENLMDICNLALNNPDLVDRHSYTSFVAKVEKALEFYQEIQFPDNRPPLFGDTAYNTCIPAAELNNYWQFLTGKCDLASRKEHTVINLPCSGLYGYRDPNSMLIFTAGEITPRYQPGHMHCDMLSYELMLGNQRIIVDTGVAEYESGSLRYHCRSTAAHNTIQLDNVEQSEIWGDFRVARRSEPLYAKIVMDSQNQIVCFKGAYIGFPGIPGGVKHSRQAELAIGNANKSSIFKVVDRIDGKGGKHLIKSFIHLDPSVDTSTNNDGVITLSISGISIYLLKTDSEASVVVEPCIYCPEFGKVIHSKRITIQKQSNLPTMLSYSLHSCRLEK